MVVNKCDFINIMEWFMELDSYVESLNKMNINVIETPLYECASKLFDQLLHIWFMYSAIDTIYWWLYEYEDKTKPGMWDNDDNVIPMETLEDLWNYCKQYINHD